MKLLWLVAPVALLSFSHVAEAHLDIDWPAMTGANQKAYPCGAIAAAPGGAEHIFRPGQTITIRYTETIGHEGNFRVAFAPTLADLDAPIGCGDIRPLGPDLGNPNMSILSDGLNLSASPNDAIMGCPGRVGTRIATSGVPYTVDVTLPDAECNGCLLQMIQFMSDKPPLDPDPNLTAIGQVPQTNGGNDLYFRCANITLTNDPNVEVSTDPEVNLGDADAGPEETPDAGAVAGADGGANGAGDAGTNGAEPVDGSGCQTGSQSGSLWFLLLGALLWCRRSAVTTKA